MNFLDQMFVKGFQEGMEKAAQGGLQGSISGLGGGPGIRRKKIEPIPDYFNRGSSFGKGDPKYFNPGSSFGGGNPLKSSTPPPVGYFRGRPPVGSSGVGGDLARGAMRYRSTMANLPGMRPPSPGFGGSGLMGGAQKLPSSSISSPMPGLGGAQDTSSTMFPPIQGLGMPTDIPPRILEQLGSPGVAGDSVIDMAEGMAPSPEPRLADMSRDELNNLISINELAERGEMGSSDPTSNIIEQLSSPDGRGGMMDLLGGQAPIPEVAPGDAALTRMGLSDVSDPYASSPSVKEMARNIPSAFGSVDPETMSKFQNYMNSMTRG